MYYSLCFVSVCSTVFVLDTGFHVFVWVGKEATAQEKGGGMMVAHVSVPIICGESNNNRAGTIIISVRFQWISEYLAALVAWCPLTEFGIHTFFSLRCVQEYVKNGKQPFLPITRVAQGQHSAIFQAAFEDHAPVRTCMVHDARQ